MTDPRIAPAAARFGDAAGLYEQARPGYPEELLDALAARTPLGPGTVVVDLAAGTGKLTRQLVARGATVTAIEPTAGMRRQLGAAVPGARVLDGTAEDMPLVDAAADVVTVAQAFHWFRTADALDELARVLRPGGWLALLWNEPPLAGWARELWDLRHDLTGFDGAYPGRGWEPVVDADPRFGVREVVTVSHRVITTRADLTADTATRSYVHVLDPGDRAAVLERVAAFVAEHPDTAGRTELTYERPSVLHLCRCLAT
jgi:SAM-dependent methyltransferase